MTYVFAIHGFRPAWLALAVLRGGAGLALLFALIVTAGCRTTMPAELVSPTTMPADANAALMDHIGRQPFAPADSAYRAVYLLLHGTSFDGDFAALSKELEAGKIISPTWNFTPDTCLDRQTVGYMICRAADIRSGMNWQLTGLGRYAWRELQYKRIAGAGSEMGLISGGEFLGVLLRADEYMSESRADLVQRADLGAAP